MSSQQTRKLILGTI